MIAYDSYIYVGRFNTHFAYQLAQKSYHIYDY